MERGDAVNDRVYSPQLDAKAIWSNRSKFPQIVELPGHADRQAPGKADRVS